MQSDICIVTDAGSDLQQFSDIHTTDNIPIVPLYVNFGSTSISSLEIKMKDYHNRLNKIRDKSGWPQTAAPSPGDVLKIYEEMMSKGFTKIISIHIASKLSGTYNAANIAKENMAGVDIELVDSQNASVGQLATILMVQKLLDSKKNFEEIANQARIYSRNVTSYLTLNTLDYLAMGGRISHLKYRFGRLLKLKPILILSQGEIKGFDKSRNTEKSREKMIEAATKEYAKNDEFTFLIGHTQIPDIAKTIENLVKDKFPNSQGYQGEIGPAIATHIGPKAVGLVAFN